MAEVIHSDLLQYYKRELSYLREQGADFAARYPKVASSLALHGAESLDPHTERLIEANPLREFYRARFLADFKRTPPAFFVDAIVPDNFAFNDRRRHGFELWPDLARLIAVDYYLDQSVEGYRIYRRIERKG